MSAPSVHSELNVRSESLQRLYSYFLADRFQVNRRYQRKLVWAVDEKKRLIDSALKQLPIPLILVAEKPGGASPMASFEVIDGLQRLNAIMAFIENEYAVSEGYFDLSALADTKAKLDAGVLIQREPVMSRDLSAEFANYTLALSVFRSNDDDVVDEVFRRINSSGRQLSTQDLRQAGTTSSLADLVRGISSQVRSDSSPGDHVPLRKMPALSISSVGLEYGIPVDGIYWVDNGVLNREDVRSSLDEELVLDLLIDMLIDPRSNTSTRARNAYFNFDRNSGPGSPTQQSQAIESAIIAQTPAEVRKEFEYVFDELRRIIDASPLKRSADGGERAERFCDLIGIGSRNSIPRYFHCVFIALHDLLVREQLEFFDYERAAESLRDRHQRFAIQKGGEWTAAKKSESIEVVKSFLRTSMQQRAAGGNPLAGRASFIERLLSNSRVEGQLFEIKQGFCSLEPAATDVSKMIAKIAATASAIANVGPGVEGYILVGVADGERDVERVQEVDGVTPVRFRDYAVVGLDREARRCGEDVRTYWDRVMRGICDHGAIDSTLAQQIGNESQLVTYRGRDIGVFRVRSLREPVFYAGKILERRNSETVEVGTGSYGEVYARFLSRD